MSNMTKEAAEDFFGELFLGKHHIPGEVKPFGQGWAVSAYAGWLATFDFNNLTRLVFLCHDRCVRAELNQGAPGRVKISIWQRDSRDGDICERHPTIEQALADWRKRYPSETLRTAWCEACQGEHWPDDPSYHRQPKNTGDQ